MKKIQLTNTDEKISVISQGTWGIMNQKDYKYYKNWKKTLKNFSLLNLKNLP